MAEAPLSQLLSELVRDLGELMRQELRLARSETSEKLTQAQHGVLAVLTGLLVAFSALLILLEALVLALSQVMPAWLAAVVVGVTLSVIALILILTGRRNLKAKNLLPERALRAARHDKDMVMENVK